MVTPKLTNNQVKQYASLKYKKYRIQHGLFTADGFHLVEEVIKSGWPVERIIARHDTVKSAQKLNIPHNLLVTVSSSHFKKITPSSTPQGLLAVCKTRDYADKTNEIIKRSKQLIACENVSDPGNLGTIIRTAAAFNYDSVILIGNCADVYNPKTVTATQGALFQIPILNINSISSFIEQFGEKFDLVCLSGNYKTKLSSCPKLKYPLPIMGGETSGISPELERAAEHLVRIEQSDRVDSLNVSVAAGIAMYIFGQR